MKSSQLLTKEELIKLGVSDQNIENVFHIAIGPQVGFCEDGSLPVTGGKDIIPIVNISQYCVPKDHNYVIRVHHPNNEKKDDGTGVSLDEKKTEPKTKIHHISFASSHFEKNAFEVIDVPVYSVKNGLLQEAIVKQMLLPEHCMEDTPDTFFHPRFDTRHLLIENIIEIGRSVHIASYGMILNNANELDNDFSFTLKRATQDAAKAGKKSILVMDGLAFDSCLLYSAQQAARMGFTVVVLRDATKSVNEKNDEETTRKFIAAGIRLTTTDAFRKACQETFYQNFTLQYQSANPTPESKAFYREWKSHCSKQRLKNVTLLDLASDQEKNAHQLIEELSKSIQEIRDTSGVDLSNRKLLKFYGIRDSLQARLQRSLALKETKSEKATVVIKARMETGKLDSQEIEAFREIIKRVENEPLIPVPSASINQLIAPMALANKLNTFLETEISRMTQKDYTNGQGSQKLHRLLFLSNKLKNALENKDFLLNNGTPFIKGIQDIASAVDKAVAKHLGNEDSWGYSIKSTLFYPTSKKHLNKLIVAETNSIGDQPAYKVK